MCMQLLCLSMNQTFLKKVCRKAIITAGKYVSDKYRREMYNSAGIPELAAHIASTSGQLMVEVIESFLPVQNQEFESGFSRVNVGSGELLLVHLDGQEGFIYGQPNFSIGICYLEKGVSKLAGVFNPYYKELFFAETEKGLRRNNLNAQVNDVRSLSDSFLGFSYRGGYDARGQERLNLLFRIMRQPVRTMIPGSDLYGLTLLANGNLTGVVVGAPVFNLLRPGLFIVEQAGGVISDHLGNPATENSEFIIASNGAIHKELIRHFQEQSTLSEG